jgi:hypothetical protein
MQKPTEPHSDTQAAGRNPDRKDTKPIQKPRQNPIQILRQQAETQTE